MKIQDAEKMFGLPRTLLEQYVSAGLLRPEEQLDCKMEYRDEDFQYLSLINTLTKVGFSLGEVKYFLNLQNEDGTKEEQIRMLRQRRRGLLEMVHENQRLIDHLDYLIRNVK